MELFPQRTLRFRKASVGISFNPTSQVVVDAMRRNTFDAITDLTEDQKRELNDLLTEMVAQGLSPVQVANEVGNIVGLTEYQQSLVDTYQALLESTSAAALDRVLRDRRFDGTLESAIDANDVLSADQIERMVERYTDNLLNMRGEMIARTESMRVIEEQRQEATEQQIESAGVDRGLVVKQWQAVHDARTRDTHAGLDGQARLLDDPFDSESGAQLMYPGDENAPAEEVINCRCTVAHLVFSSQEEVDAFLAENGQGAYGQ